MEIVYSPIGCIHSPFTSLQGMPIQPRGAADVEGRIEIYPQFRLGLRDLDGFSHVYVLSHLHAHSGYSLMVTPFLDTEQRGLFATRASKRPNPIGLSVLRLKEVAEDGLVVLGFPCNQFGAQEKGSDDEIASFCELNFGVSFPLMHKIEVNGDGAHPLYRWLTSEAPGVLGTKSIKWNFTKFLVGRDGQVIRRYAPQDKPEKLADDIQAALG